MEAQCYVTGTSASTCYGPQGVSAASVYECGAFMSVSPNPAVTSFDIGLPGQIAETEAGEVELLDIYGQLVERQTWHGKKFNISVADLPEGAYVLRVRWRDEILTHRVVIGK